MANTIIILTNYLCYGENSTWAQDNLSMWVGWNPKGDGVRGACRFPLTDLPPDAIITKVEIQFWVVVPGGEAHLLDIYAYNGDGQADPQDDFEVGWSNQCGQRIYDKAKSAKQYYNDGTECRATGTYKVTLLGTICDDIEAAKAAVNRFALGFVEDGDNDQYANISSSYLQIEITYELPPGVGYSYSDGLVTVQVAG